MTAIHLSKSPLFTPALGKRLIAGAAIGLVLIGFFLITAGKGNPAWGDYWRVKPLLLTPALSALVGLCYDITQPLRNLKGWQGKLFLVVSLLGYAVGIWLSLILGMAGTLWN
ncbi:MAG: potassium transporter KefB [Bacteroidetes bacterium]|nr:potassium transporter KefB [Bacteroidota bacterium]